MDEQQRQMTSETYGSVITEVEKNRQKRIKEAKQKEFDQKIVELADKAIEFEQKRGQDDSLTVLLVNFLDVAIEMKNLMETMSAINVAMECLSDAIGFLDAAIDFDNNLMDDSLAHNYGFLERSKAKRKMKKTIKNNCGRMLAIANGLAMKYKMATDMMSSLTKVSGKLKTALGKTAKKRQKKAAKTGQPIAATAAEQFIAERKQGNGTSSSAPTAPTSPVGGTSDVGGIDDII